MFSTKQAETLYFIFFLEQGRLKIIKKNICARTGSTDLISKYFKKHIHLMTQSLSVMPGGHKEMSSFFADY
jgi:hypothetical protein